MLLSSCPNNQNTKDDNTIHYTSYTGLIKERFPSLRKLKKEYMLIPVIGARSIN